MLIQQSKKIQYELRTVRQQKELREAQQKQIEENVAELKLDTLAYEKQLKALISEKESVLVFYDMKRFEMKKLKDNLLESVSQVLSLDREQKDLEKTIPDQKKRATKAAEERRLRIRLQEDSKHKISIDVAQKVLNR